MLINENLLLYISELKKNFDYSNNLCGVAADIFPVIPISFKYGCFP